MYKTDEFMERYRELENWANGKYGSDGIRTIEEEYLSGKARNEVRYFRSVRNLLAHNPNKEIPLIELTDDFKLRFKKLCDKLMSSSSKIIIPYKDIYKRVISDKVLPTISYMKEQSYSYVPIMNNKKIWGVFSENTLFNIIGDGNMELLNEDTPLFKIGSYITEYSNEGSFDFIKDNTSTYDIMNIFSTASENNRRLDALYITTTGDKDGDLVGLVTVWDLPKLDN